MKKGGLELEKIVAIIIILAVLFMLIVILKGKFDFIKEMIFGMKAN